MNSSSIYLAKIIICQFSEKVNSFFSSIGQSYGQSIGKSNVTSTSTITSTSIIKNKRIYAKPPSAALLLNIHLNVQFAQNLNEIFDVSSHSRFYRNFQYLLRQKTKMNPEAFQRFSDHIKIRVSSIHKAYRLFQKYFRKNKLND